MSPSQEVDATPAEPQPRRSRRLAGESPAKPKPKESPRREQSAASTGNELRPRNLDHELSAASTGSGRGRSRKLEREPSAASTGSGRGRGRGRSRKLEREPSAASTGSGRGRERKLARTASAEGQGSASGAIGERATSLEGQASAASLKLEPEERAATAAASGLGDTSAAHVGPASFSAAEEESFWNELDFDNLSGAASAAEPEAKETRKRWRNLRNRSESSPSTDGDKPCPGLSSLPMAFRVVAKLEGNARAAAAADSDESGAESSSTSSPTSATEACEDGPRENGDLAPTRTEDVQTPLWTDPLEAVEMDRLTPIERSVVQQLRRLPVGVRMEIYDKLDEVGWSSASLCSCSGSDTLLKAIVTYFANPNARYQHHYACESQPDRAAHLTDVVYRLDDTCVFEKAEDMPGTHAKCWTHKGKKCKIPEGPNGPLFLNSGFSCTSFSKLFAKYKDFKGCVAAKDGSSGITAFATAETMHKHDIPMGMVENLLDLLRDVQAPNWEALQEMFRANGIEIQGYEKETQKDGHCERRPRMMALLLQSSSLGISAEEAREILRRVEARLLTLRLPPMAVEECLFDNDDPRVTAQLEQMLTAKTGERAESDVWVRKTCELLETKGIAWSACVPPDAVMESPWAAVLTKRELKILGIEAQLNPDSIATELHHSTGWTTRSSEADVEETDPGHKDTALLPPCLPESRVYLWTKHRLMIGEEYLNVQQYPVRLIRNRSDGQKDAFDRTANSTKTQMAGNAFAGASYTSLLIAAMAEIPVAALKFFRNRVVSDEEDVVDTIKGLRHAFKKAS